MQSVGDIEDLVMAYPGPAFCCLSDGSECICNAAAKSLTNWPGLPAMAASAIASRAGSATATWRTPLGEGENRLTMEWIAFPILPAALLALGRDVTMEARLSQVLAESRQRYRDFIELSRDFIWETGGDGRFVLVSPRGGFGYSAKELTSQPSGILLAEETTSTSPFHSPTAIDGRETWLRCRNGSLALVSLSAHPLTDKSGTTLGFRGICRPIGETFQQGAGQPDSLSRVAEYVLRPFSSDQDTSSAATHVVAAATRALSAAGVVLALRDAPETPPRAEAFSTPPSAKTLETLLRAISEGGTPILGEHLMIAPAWKDGATIGGLAAWRMETAFRPEEKQLFSLLSDRLGPALSSSISAKTLTLQSRTDPLTGLANRRHFEEIGETMMSRGIPCALIFMDMDNFKPVNDFLGHAKGDTILREVAHIIAGAIRRNDLAARIGGDEFAILVDGGEDSSINAIKCRIEKSAAALKEFSASPKTPIGISIGTARPLPGDTLETLMARADQEMYAKKRAHKGERA